MKYLFYIFSVLTFVLTSLSPAQTNKSKLNKSERFSHAKLYFEQNATDGDIEAVFEIQGNEGGLIKLSIISPDGKTIIDFTVPEKSTLGIRQFRFESPEPKDIKSIKAAYPEGDYQFTGTTLHGKMLIGTCKLIHKLPSTTSFIQPKPKAKGVGLKDLKIMWAPVKDITSYILYIEEGNFDFTVTLPASINELTLPEGILMPHTEYTLGIGTKSKEGNLSFIETSFITGN